MKRSVTKTLTISVRTGLLGAYIQMCNFYMTNHDCWNIDLWTNQYLDSQKLSVHPVAKYAYSTCAEKSTGLKDIICFTY